MAGGGPSAPPPDYAGMWETVSKWQQDAAIDRQRRLAGVEAEIGRMESRAAARGRTFEGGERMMKERSAAIEKDYEAAMEKLKGSESYQMLQDKYKRARKAAIRERPTGKYQSGGGATYEKGGAFQGEGGGRGGREATVKGGGRGEGWEPAYVHDERGNRTAVTEVMSRTDTWDTKKYGNTFEEWAAAEFGNVESSYAESEKMTAEEKAMERAKAAAGGSRAAAAQQIKSKEKMATQNPWMQPLGQAQAGAASNLWSTLRPI